MSEVSDPYVASPGEVSPEDLEVLEDTWSLATEGSPFSNSDEGLIWTGRWCANCRHDAPFRAGSSSVGCPLVLISMCGRTPVEWERVAEPTDRSDVYHCEKFVAVGP
jgi:hypothetical protein